jgi:hypothetical protein
MAINPSVIHQNIQTLVILFQNDLDRGIYRSLRGNVQIEDKAPFFSERFKSRDISRGSKDFEASSKERSAKSGSYDEVAFRSKNDWKGIAHLVL